jgi:molybdopterin-guanine dinucleotide biosynthesis protein A
VIAAVMAGGRGRRMGGGKPLAPFGGEPLIARPIAAARAAGLEPVVFAKRGFTLPGVRVEFEPDEPTHPLCGLVTALQHGPVVALACDQPWLTGELLAALAAAPGLSLPVVDGQIEPFPGRYEPDPALHEALAREAPLRATLAALRPAPFDLEPFGGAHVVASVNTPEELSAAERAL